MGGVDNPQTRVQVRPERTALAAVVVMMLGALPLALSSPWLAPLLVVPVGVAVWVLRARVVGTRAGLEVCNGLGVRRLRWQEVSGFDVPRRGPVVLQPAAGGSIRLTALPRRDLPRLLDLSRPS